MFFGISDGYFGMFDAVEFILGKVGNIVISPVIQKEIMQEPAAGCGLVIQFQYLARLVGKIRNFHHMLVNGRIMMIKLFKLKKFFMFVNITDNLVKFTFHRSTSMRAGHDSGRY